MTATTSFICRGFLEATNIFSAFIAVLEVCSITILCTHHLCISFIYRLYDVDESVQLVCKYLRAFEHRNNVKYGINKLYDENSKFHTSSAAQQIKQLTFW